MANLQPINNNDDNDEEQILQKVMKASMDTYAFEQTKYIGNTVYEDEPELDLDLDNILKQIKELTEKEALQNTHIPIIPINDFNNDNDNNYSVNNSLNIVNNSINNSLNIVNNDVNNDDNDDNDDNDVNDDVNDDNNDDDDMVEILENIRLLEETEREQKRIQLIEQEKMKLKHAIASNRIMRDEQDAEYNNSLLIDKQKEQEKAQKKAQENAQEKTQKIHIQSIQTSLATPIINNNIDVASGVNDDDDYEVIIPPTKEQMRQARLARFNK